MIAEIIEVAKYTLPALIVLATTYVVLKSILKNEAERKKFELALQDRKITTPVRLQAYERATLFLERISFESMLKRHVQRNQTASQLQQKLLTSIRQEFEHNYSQQIYLSHESWQMLIKAKENIIQIINTTVMEMKPNEPSLMMSQRLLEKVMEMDQTPSARAIEFLKKEAIELF